MKVLDFGIAKMASLSSPASLQTRTGVMIGTAYYASPEQLEGSKALDSRTDIWAMGVIAFECLLGMRPFEGESIAELVLRICTRPIPVPSENGPVPPGFDLWFARACARDLGQRFGTIRELSDSLRALPGRSDTVLGAPPDDLRPRSTSLARTTSPVVETSQEEVLPAKRTARLVTGGTIVALLMIGAGLWLTRPSASDDSSPTLSNTVASAPRSAGAPATPLGDPALAPSITLAPAAVEPSPAQVVDGASGGPATTATRVATPNAGQVVANRRRPTPSPAKPAEPAGSTPARDPKPEPIRLKPIPTVPRDPLETR